MDRIRCGLAVIALLVAVAPAANAATFRGGQRALVAADEVIGGLLAGRGGGARVAALLIGVSILAMLRIVPVAVAVVGIVVALAGIGALVGWLVGVLRGRSATG